MRAVWRSPSAPLGYLRFLTVALLLLAVAAAISTPPLPLAAGAVLGVAGASLILLRPEFGLYALIFAIPLGSLIRLGSGPASLPATEMAVAFVLAVWLLQAISRRRLSLHGALLPITLLIFIGVLTLSALRAEEPLLALKEIIKWSELLLLFWLVPLVVRQPRQLRFACYALLLAGALEAVLGAFQFLTRTGPVSFQVSGFLRAYGTFGQPNPYAGYLALLFCFFFSLGLPPEGRRASLAGIPPWLLWGTLAVIAIALLMSLSRGAWLGVLLAAALVIVVRRRKWLPTLVLLLAGASLILVSGTARLLPTEFTARLGAVTSYVRFFRPQEVAVQDENWAIAERLATWQAAWAMFQDHPWLGVGAGNFSIAHEDYALPDWDIPTPHAHNYYLNLMAESGVLGVTAYLGVLAAAFLWLLRHLRREASLPRDEPALRAPVLLGVTAGLVALSVHNLFDSLFVHGITAQLGLMLGLAAAVTGGLQREQATRESTELREAS